MRKISLHSPFFTLLQLSLKEFKKCWAVAVMRGIYSPNNSHFPLQGNWKAANFYFKLLGWNPAGGRMAASFGSETFEKALMGNFWMDSEHQREGEERGRRSIWLPAAGNVEAWFFILPVKTGWCLLSSGVLTPCSSCSWVLLSQQGWKAAEAPS